MGKIDVDLSGKVALITGAGKGIGRNLAINMAKKGAFVAGISRTEEDLKTLKDEIKTEGGDCHIQAGNICDTSNIPKLVDEVFNWKGKIDILINAAGTNIQNHTLEVTEKEWDAVLNTNLKGAFFLSQGVAKKMVPYKKGKIINITSTMAFVGFYKRAAYCASKGGLSQLTKVMAVELAPYNIQVNCVAPTFIKTPLTEPMFKDKDFYEEVVSRIPLGYIGSVDDVTGAVLFLASDSSNFVTGSSIIVDGGWIAW